MEATRKRFPRKVLIGCIGVPLLGILALCGGPRVYSYFYERSVISEFRSNRAYYERLVRQIQADGIPVNGQEFYILPKSRYAGETMRKSSSLMEGLHDGTTVWASNWNGVLRVDFAMRVNSFPFGFPSQFGVTFCAGESVLPHAEQSVEKFEDHWWFYSWWLGK